MTAAVAIQPEEPTRHGQRPSIRRATLLAACLVWLTLRHALRPASNRGARLDIAGQVLAIMALGLFTWAIIEGQELGWGSPPIIGAMLAAVAAAAGFVQVERRAAEPMLPPDLFRGNAAARVSVIAALHNIGIYGQLFAAGLFLQRVLDFTPLRAGMVLLPMTAAIALLAFVSGRWIARSGPYQPLNTGHAVATAGSIGLASLAAFGNGASTPLLLLFLLAVGVGAGLASPPMTTALLAVLPQERSGLAGGVLNTSRQIGNVFGIALIGAVITSFGGVGNGAGYVVAWLLAASALGTNVVLGVMLASNTRQQQAEIAIR